MSTDDDVTGRDLRTIWRTIAVFVVAGTAVAGAVLAGIVREVRQDARIEALEQWKAEVLEEAKQEKRRERWRQERREQFGPPKPSAFVPSQITRREVNVRIVEIDGERFALLAERDLLAIVGAAHELAEEVKRRKACGGWL